MDLFKEAVKANDLVKAKKAVGSIMSERTRALIEARKVEIAKKVMIEGEDKDVDDEDDEKQKKIDADNKNSGKSFDSKPPKSDEDERTA